MNSIKEIAYRLWQIRSANGVKTSPEQDWYDAERIFSEENNTSNKELIKLKVIVQG
jgi:hypothetical protein